MQKDEIVGELKSLIVPFKGEGVEVSRATTIYHDLWIAGDDAGELLDAIHNRFAADFREMSFEKYFPNEGEVFPEHILKLLGFRKKAKWRRLTVGHLVDVIQSGKWFEPENDREYGDRSNAPLRRIEI
jgi:hypothetical protein